MGQCYTVYLKVKFKDENGAIEAIKDRLTNHGEYSLENYRTGLDYDTIDGCLRHFYSNWEDGHKWTPIEDQDCLCGDFNATYSWESTMMEVFELLSPYLEDGSEIEIYPDSGVDHAIVKNGNAKWVS